MAESAVRIDARRPETRIERRLTSGSQFGEGGMSLLIDSIDTNLMRAIAMKILREDMVKDEHALGVWWLKPR